MTLRPQDLARRSFLWRKLVDAGARFAEVNGTAAAMDFGAPKLELDVARRMGLADLSPLPRTGYKGRGALDWLRGRGVTVPDANNMAAPQPDGSLACRLAPSEALLLDALDGAPGLSAELDAAWPGPDAGTGAYKVPRPETNLWVMLTGAAAAGMFAKICGVDLRPAKFADHAIAQTQVARLSGIVVRADLGDTLAYHFLTDSASAAYVWDVLTDAIAEFDGGPVGLAALQQLARA
ncbi:MAG: sarcosine oxidase [Alphaproteobacteria bacterium]